MESVKSTIARRCFQLVVAFACAVVAVSLCTQQAFAAELTAGSDSPAAAASASANDSRLKACASKPKASKVLSMTFKSGKLTMKWQKVPGVDGYELEYKQETVDGDEVVKSVEFTKKRNAYNAFKKCSLTGFTALTGDVLVAKVRTFKIVGKKRVYSSWSANKICVTRTTWNATFMMPQKLFDSDGEDVSLVGPIGIGEWELKGKVSRVKNKNPKVAWGKVWSDSGDFDLYIRKSGKAVVLFDLLGKRITMNVTVVKWSPPLALLKIGSVDYTKEANREIGLDPTDYATNIYAELKAPSKLVIKPAKNWKIVSMKTGDKTKKTGDIEEIVSYKEIKSGYYLKPGGWYIDVILRNTKTKAWAVFDIDPE